MKGIPSSSHIAKLVEYRIERSFSADTLHSTNCNSSYNELADYGSCEKSHTVKLTAVPCRRNARQTPLHQQKPANQAQGRMMARGTPLVSQSSVVLRYATVGLQNFGKTFLERVHL